MQSYQTELFPNDDSYRSTDNQGLEPLPKGKASPFVKWEGRILDVLDQGEFARFASQGNL